MAGIASEESGVGKSVEGISSGQRCHSGEALAEWRSSEQVENGVPSTSPPYWDTDDDEDGGMFVCCVYLSFIVSFDYCFCHFYCFISCLYVLFLVPLVGVISGDG